MNNAGERSLLAILFALISIFFVFFNLDAMWSGAVDLAHHYALAYRLSENWVLKSSSDPTLGEMNFYPRGAHILAAVVGRFVGSPFLGIQCVTLGALAALWCGIVLILKSLKGRLAVFSLATFSVLLIVNFALKVFELHGNEVISNFFYSQLVGHAILYIALYACIELERKAAVFWSIACLGAVMLLVAKIHLLPAIEMLGVIGGLLATYIFFGSTGGFLRRLLIAAPVGIAAIVALMLHPSFLAMKAIAENNGALQLHHISYPYGLFLLCAVVLLASLKIFSDWFRTRKDNATLALKYISIYGAVTSCLCLVQFLALSFGRGSDYAVKKYVYGLTTVLLLELAVIIGGYLLRLVRGGPNQQRTVRYLSGLVATMALCLALFTLRTQKVLDVSDVVAMERRIQTLADTSVPVPSSAKQNVAMGLGDVPPAINYMFSIAILKTPIELAIPDVLISNSLSDLSKYAYVVSSSDDAYYGAKSCKSLSDGPISIVESDCIKQRLASQGDCRSNFDFSTSGVIPAQQLKGFAAPAASGRWTEGDSASFECRTTGQHLETLELRLAPLIYGPIASQRLFVSINGKQVGTYALSSARDAANPILIKLPSEPDTDRYIVEFGTPDSRAPRDIGLNADPRKLGFLFQRLIFR